MAVARLAKPLADQFVLLATLLIRQLAVEAFLEKAGQLAARLNAELVGGDMLRGQFEQSAQAVFEAPLAKTSDSENNIEADVVKTGFPEDGKGLPCGRSVVAPAHPAQLSVVKRLDAHADAVHAKGSQGLCELGAAAGDVIGVDLYGELIERSRSAFRQALQKSFKERERHHRWRASP